MIYPRPRLIARRRNRANPRDHFLTDELRNASVRNAVHALSNT
jgi:hypothetical protein